MRYATSSGAAARRFFTICLFTAIVMSPTSPAFGQYLGPEAYLYRQVPIPAHVIADVYIEQKILRWMQPELGHLWLLSKDSLQPVDVVIDAEFSTRPTNSAALEMRQTYLRVLLLLKQLRNAIVIYEQIYITPDSYAAWLAKKGILSAEEQTRFLAVAATYVAAGDKPQAAALKAHINMMHEAARGKRHISECYFENPQSRDHQMCVRTLFEMDRMFRDDWFRERFSLDEQAIRLLTDSFSGSEGGHWMWETVNVIDVIGLMLRSECPSTPYADVYAYLEANPPTTDQERKDAVAAYKKVRTDGRSCRFNLAFRLSRPFVIENALDGREDYRDATRQRQSQIEQDARLRAANHPLSGFFNTLAAGAAGIIIITKMNQLKRAEANAANPMWKGHENDEWCSVHFDYDGRGYGQEHTYCESYNGMTRSPSGLFAHCKRLNGWCEPE